MTKFAHARFVLILGALTMFGPLSIDMYLPAFSQIGSDFDTSFSRVEFSLAAFFIGLSLGQFFYGPLADRFGRKPPLYFGLALYVLASIGCALAPNIESLIALRFLQALGACAGMVIARAMVRDLFDHRESIKVFSTLVLVMGVAPILAPIFGAYILTISNWHTIFSILAVFASLCLIAVYVGLPETRKANREVKLSRALHTYLDILKDRKFIVPTLTGGLAQAGMFAYITGSSFVFVNLFGIQPQSYGYLFGANALGLIALAQLNGRLAQTLGPEKILGFSLKFMAFSGIALMIASFLELGFLGILLPLFGYIAILGMVFPNTTAGALSGQGHRAGAASALLGTLQFLCATIASTFVSVFHAQNVFPMVLTVAACGILSFGVYQFREKNLINH